MQGIQSASRQNPLQADGPVRSRACPVSLPCVSCGAPPVASLLFQSRLLGVAQPVGFISVAPVMRAASNCCLSCPESSFLPFHRPSRTELSKPRIALPFAGCTRPCSGDSPPQNPVPLPLLVALANSQGAPPLAIDPRPAMVRPSGRPAGMALANPSCELARLAPPDQRHAPLLGVVRHGCQPRTTGVAGCAAPRRPQRIDQPP